MTRTLIVENLTRVEGEGGLTLTTRADGSVEVQLRIFEPPRFFEGLLCGRAAAEAPDITARICGICPVAYQMSACGAIEAALGLRITPELRALRRLFYFGEWIESHVLHMALLHLPDFLGVHSVVELSRIAPERVQAALRLKKAGNLILRVVGGREIHPVSGRIGGFFRAPPREELREILPELRAALGEAEELLAFCAGLAFPAVERDVELLALRGPGEYPLCEGRIVSTRGLDIDVAAFEENIVEEQVRHSTALHARIAARGTYLVGPLARIALNFDQLSPRARDAAGRAGLTPACRNPFKSILARGVEVVQAVEESIRIIESYAQPDPPWVDAPPRAGRGAAATEAPRGLLYHRYLLDDAARIVEARIVPPTSQNQRAIEEDLQAQAPLLAALPDAEARERAEHAIRNYDPCISCATHFLRVRRS